MSILVNKDTKVIVQGITGKAATFHTRQMLDYGTKVKQVRLLKVYLYLILWRML